MKSPSAFRSGSALDPLSRDLSQHGNLWMLVLLNTFVTSGQGALRVSALSSLGGAGVSQCGSCV